MKKFLLLSVISLFLTSCSEKQSDSSKITDTIINQITTSANITISRPDTSSEAYNRLRDPYDFEMEIYSPEFDSLIKAFNSNKKVRTEIKRDSLADDCGVAYKRFIDTINNVKLYFYKGDCVEDYGFGNSQHLFSQDTLSMAREYSFNNIGNSSDTTLKTIWESKEVLFFVNKDKVIIKERRKTTTNNRDFILYSVAFKDSIVDKVKFLKERDEQFKLMLED